MSHFENLQLGTLILRGEDKVMLKPAFSSPDVSVLPYVQAVKVGEVGFAPVVALGLGQPLDHLGFQLHRDVPRQHRQEELLLLPWKQTGCWVNCVWRR